jgi:hypothetical protein
VNLLTADLVDTLLLAMRASEAAYDIDETRARADFAALGCAYVGLVRVPSRWVYVLRRDGRNLIVGQGTRVTSDFDEEELLADIDLIPTRTPHGLAPDGFAGPIFSGGFLRALKSLVDPALPVDMTGHSLGAETVQLLAPEFPGCSVYPIDPPTGASHEYLAAIRGAAARIVPYVRDRSFAWGWGVGLHFHQILPFVWQRQGKLLQVTERATVVNISVPDHSLDGSLAAVAALKVPA